MASLVACLASEAACCFTSAACRCCCKLCGYSLSSSTATRLSYASMFLLTAISSWTMKSDWAVKKLESLSHGYLKIECPEGECYGILAIYRICFATFIFHLLLGGLMYGVRSSSEPRAGFQNGWWGVKIILWLGLVVADFFVPNGVFIFWSKYFAMGFAGIFVLLQVVLLIDFAYGFSESLLEKWDETGEKKYIVALSLSTFTLFVAAIVITGFLYAWFAPSCQQNQFFITFNLTLSLLMSIVAVLPKVQEVNPTSGLAQSAIVSCYATYLVASAISSEPDLKCNPIIYSSRSQTWTVAIGALFTFVALAYSTSRAATQGHVLGNDDNYMPVSSQPTNESMHVRNAIDSGALKSESMDSDREGGRFFDSTEDDESEGTQYSAYIFSLLNFGVNFGINFGSKGYCFFHGIFSFAACYLAMLLTNWNTLQITSDSDDASQWSVGKSEAAVWVKVVSSWIVLILYGWTLIAPLVLKDREW